MSEQAAVAKGGVASISRTMRVAIKGRCDRVRRYDNRFFTVVTTPAPDEYSRPSVLEIRSNSRFVEPGDTFSCEALLSGFAGRSYQVTDKDTGERRTVNPVNLFLDLVE
jgi:hypothetical protein